MRGIQGTNSYLTVIGPTNCWERGKSFAVKNFKRSNWYLGLITIELSKFVLLENTTVSYFPGVFSFSRRETHELTVIVGFFLTSILFATTTETNGLLLYALSSRSDPRRRLIAPANPR